MENIGKHHINILCPKCKRPILNIGEGEVCNNCNFKINYLHQIPILRTLEENERIDFLNNSEGLPKQDTSKLQIPFIQEAYKSNKLVLQLGAGADIAKNKNLVKTDSYLYSTSLDYIVDAHDMPFADNTFDYVFSLAVFEHLHSPWQVANEIYRVLKPGGKVFTLAAFMQSVHGYPNHYFNMTDMGLKRLFDQFVDVECYPSRNTSFSQISFILYNLIEMITKIDPSLLEKSKMDVIDKFFDIDEEESGIKGNAKKKLPSVQLKIMKCLIHLISDFDKEFMEIEECRANWHLIAPAFELTATKPHKSILRQFKNLICTYHKK